MTRNPRALRTAAVLGLAVVAPLALAGCESKTASADAIAVTSTDDACTLATASATTGDVSFRITNNGKKVTEFYVYGTNNRVLGEVENIGPGLTGKMTAEITEPGEYQVACKPGMVGNGIRQTLKVTGEKKDRSQAPADVEAAKQRYLGYMRGQVAALVSQTGNFVGHIKIGNLDAARAEFGLTRTSYERVEPVAESFPDLDPKIDMRWDDTEDGKEGFTGFHRIERFLWPPKAAEVGEGDGKIAPADAADAKNDTKEAIDKVADQLLADVTSLQTEVNKPGFEFETGMFVKGPQALIDEIAKTKVGGEEDRYSHTDLWDFAANIDGAETLIAELKPMIAARDAKTMDRITAQFGDVRALLEKLRQGDGYVDYSTVTEDVRRQLSDRIDALSATLSQVPGLVLDAASTPPSATAPR